NSGKKVEKTERTERPCVLAKLNQFKGVCKEAVVDRTCLFNTALPGVRQLRRVPSRQQPRTVSVP
ncbi:hypothetical protein BLA28_32640, partial [Eisenbergiella tayi]